MSGLPDAPQGMFVCHLVSLHQRSSAPRGPVTDHRVTLGNQIAGISPDVVKPGRVWGAGGKVGGGHSAHSVEPGVALCWQVGEEVTAELVGDVQTEVIGDVQLVVLLVPVFHHVLLLPGVPPGVPAVRPRGRPGQVGEGLQPAAGQVGLLQVVPQ